MKHTKKLTDAMKLVVVVRRSVLCTRSGSEWELPSQPRQSNFGDKYRFYHKDASHSWLVFLLLEALLKKGEDDDEAPYFQLLPPLLKLAAHTSLVNQALIS